MPINLNDTGTGYFSLKPFEREMLLTTLSRLSPTGISYWTRAELGNSTPLNLTILGGAENSDKPEIPKPTWQLYRITDFFPLPSNDTPQSNFTTLVDNYLKLSRPNTDIFQELVGKLALFLKGDTVLNTPFSFTEQFPIGALTSSPLGLFSRATANGPTASCEIRFSSIPTKASSWSPVYTALPARKPRKWGRSTTKRWEYEHALLVDFRAFTRNKNRMKRNPNKYGLGRKGTGKRKKPCPEVDSESLVDKGKRIIQKAAMSAVDAGVKRIKDKAKKDVGRAIRKRIVNALKRKL